MRPIDSVQAAREGRSGAYPLPGGGIATLMDGAVHYGSETNFQGNPGESYARSKAAEIVFRHESTHAPDWIDRTLDEAFAFDGDRGHVGDAFWREIQGRLGLDAASIADAIRMRLHKDR